MNEKVYNEIRNRKERLKQSIEIAIQKGEEKNETLEIMLNILTTCKINVNDRLKGVNSNEKT